MSVFRRLTFTNSKMAHLFGISCLCSKITSQALEGGRGARLRSQLQPFALLPLSCHRESNWIEWTLTNEIGRHLEIWDPEDSKITAAWTLKHQTKRWIETRIFCYFDMESIGISQDWITIGTATNKWERRLRPTRWFLSLSLNCPSCAFASEWKLPPHYTAILWSFAWYANKSYR